MIPLPDSQHAVLAAMLAPALLMTATAALITSANARLARVVDRLRGLISDWHEGGHERPDAALRELLIRRHRRRAYLVLRACQLLYGAMGSFVGTSLALAVDALLGYRFGALPTMLAVLGVSLLLVACAAMGMEVSMAVQGFDREIQHERPR